MKIGHLILSSGLILTFLLVGCNSSAEMARQTTLVAANIYATLTAQAPTVTPSAVPLPTQIPTLPQISTLTSAPLPTPTLPAAVDGWRNYVLQNFSVSIPEDWKVIDISPQTESQIASNLQSINEDWARMASSMMSSEQYKQYLKLIAIDPHMAGTGYTNFLVENQTLPFEMPAKDVCTQLVQSYQQLKVAVQDSNCSIQINGKDAGTITVRLSNGSIIAIQKQIIFTHQDQLWLIGFTTQEAQVGNYTSTFNKITNSFKILTP
jgi:hypothetical protein